MLERSIRTTLIVSDTEGYDIVTTLKSGINFNKTVCNVILKKDGTEGDLEAAYNDFLNSA